MYIICVNTSSIGLVTRYVGIWSVYRCALVGLQEVYGDYSVKRVVKQLVKSKLCYYYRQHCEQRKPPVFNLLRRRF